MRKAYKISKTTASRSVFNRAYKANLSQQGMISCARCPYHRVENTTTKWYGGFDDKVKYPSWKLTSKNPKQWMDKCIKVKVTPRKDWRMREYTMTDIIFQGSMKW